MQHLDGTTACTQCLASRPSSKSHGAALLSTTVGCIYAVIPLFVVFSPWATHVGIKHFAVASWLLVFHSSVILLSATPPALRSVHMTSLISRSRVLASSPVSSSDGPAKLADNDNVVVQPPSHQTIFCPLVHPSIHSLRSSAHANTIPRCLSSQSTLETLPVEIVNQILSYLTHPRSRLPGLTETQSAFDFPRQAKFDIKNREDLTTHPDTDRWAADLFAWTTLCHPFNALALTSKRCNKLVESYCSHLVRSCNMFSLPFAHLDKYGSKCVYPDLSHIVYRRLWLQHAPRKCVFCYAVLDRYPFPRVKRIIAACEDCFLRQALVCLLPRDLFLHHLV